MANPAGEISTPGSADSIINILASKERHYLIISDFTT
jgi:hypothetical protein